MSPEEKLQQVLKDLEERADVTTKILTSLATSQSMTLNNNKGEEENKEEETKDDGGRVHQVGFFQHGGTLAAGEKAGNNKSNNNSRDVVIEMTEKSPNDDSKQMSSPIDRSSLSSQLVQNHGVEKIQAACKLFGIQTEDEEAAKALIKLVLDD